MQPGDERAEAMKKATILKNENAAEMLDQWRVGIGVPYSTGKVRTISKQRCSFPCMGLLPFLVLELGSKG